MVLAAPDLTTGDPPFVRKAKFSPVPTPNCQFGFNEEEFKANLRISESGSNGSQDHGIAIGALVTNMVYVTLSDTGRYR